MTREARQGLQPTTDNLLVVPRMQRRRNDQGSPSGLATIASWHRRVTGKTRSK